MSSIPATLLLEDRTRSLGDDVVAGIEPEGRSRPMYRHRTPEPKAPERDRALHVPATEWTW